jgi:tRNA threonylcarbamoyladenosine biosynthesis protein TsaE
MEQVVKIGNIDQEWKFFWASPHLTWKREFSLSLHTILELDCLSVLITWKDMFEGVAKSPEETARLAALLGGVLRPGDVVILQGELAAGKTYLVQALAKALGSVDYTSSPTFTIANFYRYPAGQLLHIDAYRIGSMAEFRDLGLDEYFEEVITLIEWGGKVAEDFPDYLMVEFDFVPDQEGARLLRLSAEGDRWTVALNDLQDQLTAFLV